MALSKEKLDQVHEYLQKELDMPYALLVFDVDETFIGQAHSTSYKVPAPQLIQALKSSASNLEKLLIPPQN